jgi:tRNA(fMet)-specific endonuclease VapC
VDVISASMYLLDTNITGYIVSGRSQAARNLLKQMLAEAKATIMVSTITEAEIFFGLERKPEAIRLRASVLALLQTVQIRAWDSDAAQAYGRLRANLRTSGKTLAEMDLLIASHAIAIGATLVTHDQAFKQLTPLLTVVDWATDL